MNSDGNVKVTITEVYALVDRMRIELSGDIRRLENKFDTLEAGRLSFVEREVATIKAEIEPVRKIIYGLTAFVLLAVLGAVVYSVVIKN